MKAESLFKSNRLVGHQHKIVNAPGSAIHKKIVGLLEQIAINQRRLFLLQEVPEIGGANRCKINLPSCKLSIQIKPVAFQMKISFSIITLFVAVFSVSSAFSQKPAILLVGSDHFSQLYNRSNPNTDVLLPQRQNEIKDFASSLLRYRPDMIMVEVLPERQREIDSTYALYVQDKVKLEDLEDGRSEVYQLAFRMAKQLGLPTIYCVNAPGGTSQSILDNGDNIDLYRQEGLALKTLVMEKIRAFQENKLSLKDYLTFLNQPATYNKVYRLRYMTPARVTNGTFKNPDAMVDTAFVNPKYIGAELTSVFKNRDYKIYSNIVTTQLKTKAKRILLIIGAAHLGSLKSIFRDDEEYDLIDTKKFLPK